MGRVRPGCPYAGPSIMSHIVMGPRSYQFTSLSSLVSTSEWPLFVLLLLHEKAILHL